MDCCWSAASIFLCIGNRFLSIMGFGAVSSKCDVKHFFFAVIFSTNYQPESKKIMKENQRRTSLPKRHCKLLLYLSLSIIISLAFIYFCRCYYLNGRGIKVTFSIKYQNHQNNHWQIFYIADSEETKKPVQPSFVNTQEEVHCKVKIPCHVLHKIRFDFGRAPGNVMLKNVKIQGQREIALQDMKLVRFNQMEKLKTTSSDLSFRSAGKEPWILFALNDPLVERQKFDGWMFGIVSASILIIFGAVSQMLWGKNLTWDYRIFPDFVLVLLICFSLVFPYLTVDNQKNSVLEKRKLAEYKPLVLPQKEINLNYGKDFEAWFSDHFGGREKLLEFDRILARSIVPSRIHQVYAGLDGWFFYSGSHALENFHNLDAFTEEEMKESAEDFRIFADYCFKRNKKLYLFIAPNKHRVYGEFFPAPSKARPDDQSRMLKLIAYFNRYVEHQKSMTPLKRLLQEKQNYLLYYKDDTHWNEIGSYFGYLYLMEAIQEDFPKIPIWQTDKIVFKGKHNTGDLVSMASGQIFVDPSIKYAAPEYDSPFRMSGAPLDTVGTTKIINSRRDLNLLLIRDSFASAMIPFLAHNFKEFNIVWSSRLPQRYFHLLDKADIIVIEIVERDLISLRDGFKDMRRTIEAMQQ